MHLALVVLPWNAKRNSTFWFRHGHKGSLVKGAVFRVGKEGQQGKSNFLDTLQKDGLMAVLGAQVFEEIELVGSFVDLGIEFHSWCWCWW